MFGLANDLLPNLRGLLNCLAAGGMAAGQMPLEEARKEAAEEAGISPTLAETRCALHFRSALSSRLCTSVYRWRGGIL